MITLLIDGIECKVHEDNLQLPLFQASRLRSVAAWREGTRLELNVEATAEMARLSGSGRWKIVDSAEYLQTIWDLVRPCK